jgi:protoporphyrinogen oxidase
MTDVLVIGGGISGLTAAWKLAERGLGVTLLEAEDETGGQARAFEVGGKTVEHGSHAFFGYYDTIIKLIEELRADPALGPGMPALDTVPGWTLVDPYGRRAILTHTPDLPPLLGVLPSILRVPWFSVGDKIRACIGALRIAGRKYAEYDELDTMTSYELARASGYSDLGAWTWSSASLGLTNLFVQEQSGAIFAGKHAVLIASPNGLRYQLPAGNLTNLFGLPARKKIESLGGTVRCGARAVAIEEAGRPRVLLADGRSLDADHVIVALQPWDARALLPWVSAPWQTLAPVTPVITIVLQLSGLVKESADARELGTSREHWAFSVVTDLSRFWPEYAGEKTVLRAEIGHADLLPGGVDLAEELVVDLVKRDLDRLFPEVRPLTVEWARLHRENRRLYVSWTRGQFAKKPKPEDRDVGRGVFLAGDWTTRGTIGMEAAANSGLEAANHVLAATGKPKIPYRDVPLP